MCASLSIYQIIRFNGESASSCNFKGVTEVSNTSDDCHVTWKYLISLGGNDLVVFGVLVLS